MLEREIESCPSHSHYFDFFGVLLMLPYSLSCVAIVLVACALAVAHAAPNSLHCSCKAGADEDHAQLTFNASINNPPPLGNRYWIAYYEPGASCENQLARTVPTLCRA